MSVQTLHLTPSSPPRHRPLRWQQKRHRTISKTPEAPLLILDGYGKWAEAQDAEIVDLGLPEFSGLTFFVNRHRDLWFLSEASTGLAIVSRCVSKEIAVAEAVLNLKHADVSSFKKALDKGLKSAPPRPEATA